MRKRIFVLRASEDVERSAFVAGLLPALRAGGARLYLTDVGPRPATAVVCGPPDAALVGERFASILARYDVDDVVPWDEALDGPAYTMFNFFRPQAGLDHAEFVRRYRDHSKVARVHHPGIRRYVQNFVTEQAAEDRWMCGAISELHFSGQTDYRERFWRDDESRDVVARDVERFADAATAKVVAGAEIEIA